MDKVVESTEKRFIKYNKLYIDLACLTYINFYNFKNELPENALIAFGLTL